MPLSLQPYGWRTFAIAVVGLGGAWVADADALTLVVDRVDDVADAMACTEAPIDCSLRGAVRFANASVGPDEIVLPGEDLTLTLNGDGGDEIGDLNISSDVTVVGAGMDVSVIRGDDEFAHRAFNVVAGGSLSLSDLTLRELGNEQDPGGALRLSTQAVGTSTIRNVHFYDNVAAIGGAISVAGNASSIGLRLTVSDSVIQRNHVRRNSGFPGDGCGGAGLFLAQDTRIEDTLILANGPLDALPPIVSAKAVKGPSGTPIVINGGGICVGSATLTIVNSSLVQNFAVSRRNVGPANGAGIYAADATVDLDRVTFLGNTASTSGAGGAAYLLSSTLFATDVESLGNIATAGGGFVLNEVQGRLSRCEFVDNEAVSSASLPQGIGAGMLAVDSVLEMSGCTFADNVAENTAGGMYLGGLQQSFISNVTFDDNEAPSAQALAVVDSSVFVIRHVTAVSDGDETLLEMPTSSVTIINSAWDGTCDLLSSGGDPTFQGVNVGTDSTCLSGADSLVSDLELQPLREYGGPTRTRLPELSSPVLNVSNERCIAMDQRGLPRDQPCDAGAVERQSPEDVIFRSGFELIAQ